MLYGNNELVGFGTFNNSEPGVTLDTADSDSTSVLGSGSTSANLTVDIGTAATNRWVYIIAQASRDDQDPLVLTTVTSCTINGVAATLIEQDNNINDYLSYPSQRSMVTSAWVANVPTGTGDVTVNVTLSNALDKFVVASFAITGVAEARPRSWISFADGNVDTSNAPSVTAYCPADGIICALAMNPVASSAAPTWTGATQYATDNPGGVTRWSAAHDAKGAIYGAAVTADFAGSDGAFLHVLAVR